MSRCKSWRFLGAPEDPERYLPVGKDHSVWRPCHNRVEPGKLRCRECQDALIVCPSVQIRRALANEPGQDVYVLEALSSDPDPTIVAMAERSLLGTSAGFWR